MTAAATADTAATADEIIARSQEMLLKASASLKGKELGAVIQHLKEISSKMGLLQSMRACAEAVADIYNDISILEAIDLHMWYSVELGDEGQHYKDYRCRVGEIKVQPDSLRDDCSTAELAEAIEEVLNFGEAYDASSIPGARNFIGSTLFEYDKHVVYTVLDVEHGYDNMGRELAFSTDRAQVQAAANAGGIDAIAEAIFPNAWREAAQVLGLPHSEAQEDAPARPRPSV